MGWFTFGTFLILKGAFLNSVYEQKQSGGSYGYGRTFGRSLTQDLGVGNGPEEIYFKLPYIEEWTVSVMTHDMGNFHSTDSRICHFPYKMMKMCHMFLFLYACSLGSETGLPSRQLPSGLLQAARILRFQGLPRRGGFQLCIYLRQIYNFVSVFSLTTC